MTNGTQTPPTMDTNGSKAAVAIASFIANHMTSLVLTLIVGSGAAASLVYLNEKADEINEQVKDAEVKVDNIMATLNAHVSQKKIDLEVVPRLELLKQSLSEVKLLISEIDDVALDIESLKDQIEGKYETAKNHRTALQDSIKDHQKIVQQSVNENIEHRTERIRESQTLYRDEIINQIQALPEKFNSVHHALIGMFDGLISDGASAIKNARNAGDAKDGRTDALYEWMLRANYVVRSLPIPSEDGFFLNRSLVERDLRTAISEYEKNAGEDKISHAERTLQIVRAVKDLAESGRIK